MRNFQLTASFCGLHRLVDIFYPGRNTEDTFLFTKSHFRHVFLCTEVSFQTHFCALSLISDSFLCTESNFRHIFVH